MFCMGYEKANIVFDVSTKIARWEPKIPDRKSIKINFAQKAYQVDKLYY